MVLKDRQNKYASVTIDVDTLFSGLTDAQGFDGEAEALRHACYDRVVPRLLALLQDAQVRATFFLIGKDALDKNNHAIIRDILKGGHEIANHSLSHERGLSNCTAAEFQQDVEQADAALSAACGEKVVGYRMPGATMNLEKLKVLNDLGYLYDSSMNNSFIYNFSKFIYTRLMDRKLKKTPCQLNCFSRALNEPYYPQGAADAQDAGLPLKILEIPMTPVPFAGVPFFNYFLMMVPAGISHRLYTWTRKRYGYINYVLHDHELADETLLPEDMPGDKFCNAHMKKGMDDRLGFIRGMITLLKKDFCVVPLRDFAAMKNSEREESVHETR